MDTSMKDLDPETQPPAPLPNTEASAHYFKLIRRALPMALKCLAMHGTPQLDKNIYEAEVIGDMVQKLLFSASLLEIKFAFPNGDDSAYGLNIDLEESGFPSFTNIDGLAVDLMHRDASLAEMRSSEEQLKKLILDHMIEKQREPNVMLRELARRTYLELLDQDKLLLPYTPGQLIPWTVKEEGVRGYLFSWGTYSVAHNCLFVHLMFLTQDETEDAFEKCGDNLAEFLNVIKDEGSHVPDKLHLLAKSIDDRLDPIHPKILKRVRIGPIRSPFLINARPQERLSEAEAAFKELFDRAAEQDDFEMTFSEEMTYSKEQVTRKKYLFKSVVQEVFFVPLLDNDIDITRYILMPHRLYQEITPDEERHIPHYVRRIKFSYDHKEKVNEVR